MYQAVKTNEGWGVALCGKVIRWMTGSDVVQESDAKWLAVKFSSEMMTAVEMALTPHNLNRTASRAVTDDGQTWVWVQRCEKWARI